MCNQRCNVNVPACRPPSVRLAAVRLRLLPDTTIIGKWLKCKEFVENIKKINKCGGSEINVAKVAKAKGKMETAGPPLIRMYLE